MKIRPQFRPFPKVLTIAVVLLVVISQFGLAVRSASAVSGTISGTIYAPGGLPLTGVAVQVDAQLKSNGGGVATTTTNPANGTYVLSSLPFDTELVVVASGENPDSDGYYGKYYNNVTYLDWAMPFTLTIPSPTRSGVDIQLSTGSAVVEHLTFNVRADHILTDSTVRQAIGYGIDRQAIIDVAFEPRGIAGVIMNTMVYPGVWYEAPPGDPSMTVYTHDPVYAGTLLDDAGWDTFNVDGYREKDSVELALEFATTTAEARYASALLFWQQMEDIGIRVTIALYSPADFFSSDPAVSPLLSGSFDIAEFGWYIDDSDSFLGGVLTAGNEQNFGGYSNSTLDNYYFAARDAKVAGAPAFVTNALQWQYDFALNIPVLPLFLRQSTGESLGVIDVSKAGTGTGTVTANIAGIMCGTDCTETLVYGTEVTLAAIPDASSLFTGWSGACTGTGTCSITVDADNAVTATFTLKDYNLFVSKLGTGSGTVTSDEGGINCGGDCAQAYSYGTVVKLTATASPGSLFTGWGGPCSGLKFCYVTMTATRSVSATFTTIPPGTFPVTVVKAGTGSGTATSAPIGINCGTDCWEFYTAGVTVKLTATPAAGSTFVGWSGACGSMDYCWLSMGASKYVTANFMLTPAGTYPLIVARKGSGTGTVTSAPAGIACGTDCYEFYASSTLVKLTAVALPGSTFTGWSGACGGTGFCWVTMSASRWVTATFTHIIVFLSPSFDPSFLDMILLNPLALLGSPSN